MAAFNIIRATYMQSITLSDLVQVSRFYSSFKYVRKFKFCVSAVVKRYPVFIVGPSYILIRWFGIIKQCDLNGGLNLSGLHSGMLP